MSNSYYVHSNYPTPNSPGSSANLRNELELITDGFDRLPTLSGNGYKVAMVNAGGTALLASAALQNLAITSSTLNSTPIGASSPSTGAVTTLSASLGFSGNLTGNLTRNVTGNVTGNLIGNVSSTNATITGGTINNTVIGGTTPLAITGTTVTANSGFVGGLTGNVVGNVTGNVTGALTGNVTGSLSGNVTASSGSSSFNNVTINGQLDMNGATGATIINLSSPTNNGDAATKQYVDNAVANVIDSAPGALDTLNELAAALGDDANFATTITNSLATKLNLTGGTLSGTLALGTNKITGLGDPTANQDAATKGYVDTQRDTRLAVTGGTLTGSLALGGNAITGVADPTNAQDVSTKNYIDTLYGSTASAATSASAAATSASNAATSESNAATSESNAATSESNALSYKNASEAALDEFTDIYLGASNTAPTSDLDGDPLSEGSLWFDTISKVMKVYNGSAWVSAGSTVNGTANRYVYTATASQTTFSATYETGYVDVYLNGVKQLNGTDFTATSGTSVVFASPLITDDVVDIVAYGTFELINVYTKTEADAKFLSKAGGVLSGAVTFASGQTFPNYLPLAGGTLTGPLTFAAGQTFPDYLPLSGGTLTGQVNFAPGQNIDGYLANSGGSMTGDINFSLTQSFPGTASTGKAIAMSIVFG